MSFSTGDTSGRFATSRRGMDAGDIDFIHAKLALDVPVSQIARMTGRAVPDVQSVIAAMRAREAPRPPVVRRPDPRPSRAERKARAALPPPPPVEIPPNYSGQVVLSLFRGLMVAPESMTTMEDIAQAVADRHEMTLEQLKTPRKFQEIVRPRQEAMYHMVKHERWSLPEIGVYFACHHTTVLNAERAHEALLMGVRLDRATRHRKRVIADLVAA